jgi:hypothetical protein
MVASNSCVVAYEPYMLPYPIQTGEERRIWVLMYYIGKKLITRKIYILES